MALLKFVVLSLLVTAAVSQSYNVSTEVDNEVNSGIKILSRRKRFIVFPEGSSFQVVFCLTYPTIFTISDIFLFGYTAALAYELPQDPYSPFDHHADPLHRRADTKMIYFTDEKGKVLWGKKYQKKPIVNPAMAKRSIHKKLQIDRKLMHASQYKRGFLKSENMDERSVDFHRSGRATLYPKIETMLQAMGSNGKDCLLRTLCQVGQKQHHPQGSFYDEIMRAVFTVKNTETNAATTPSKEKVTQMNLPKGNESEELKEYDEAHSATKSCAALYPECDETASTLSY